jgi:cytochrome c oxidase subunit IV
VPGELLAFASHMEEDQDALIWAVLMAPGELLVFVKDMEEDQDALIWAVLMAPGELLVFVKDMEEDQDALTWAVVTAPLELLVFVKDMEEDQDVQIVLTGSIRKELIQSIMAIVRDAITDFFQVIHGFVVIIKLRKAQCSVISGSVFLN